MELRDTLAVYPLMSVRGVGRATANRIFAPCFTPDHFAGDLFRREICATLENGLLSADQIDESLTPDQRLGEQLDPCAAGFGVIRIISIE